MVMAVIRCRGLMMNVEKAVVPERVADGCGAAIGDSEWVHQRKASRRPLRGLGLGIRIVRMKGLGRGLLFGLLNRSKAEF